MTTCTPTTGTRYCVVVFLRKKLGAFYDETAISLAVAASWTVAKAG